ncbi:MAG: hypothetical protein JSW11_00020 [Candidatus Heimdallarchaeota archaeon]|nr:MAG: hypothetical protein JSW11_00020 [Candidatus Heimdallarchaeota archaeon]
MRKHPLGILRSLIVISDWISFADPEEAANRRWLYKNQDVESVTMTSVIFVPVDFSRMILYNISYLLLYGVGIYWTKFSLKKETITTDTRYLTGLVIPEEKWLNNHFSTEPFVFPPPYDFMIAGENLLEFSFNTLGVQDDYKGQSRRAFEQGRILTQLVFPLKEPLVMLRDATEKYEEFYYSPAPMRVLMSEFFNEIFVNEIAIESTDNAYEENIPGVRRIKHNLLEIFPKQWSNEVYLDGLRREVSKIADDFASIGAPMILK